MEEQKLKAHHLEILPTKRKNLQLLTFKPNLSSSKVFVNTDVFFFMKHIFYQ